LQHLGPLTERSGDADEVWAEYIKKQTPPEPDDNFIVTLVRRRRTDPALSRKSEASAF
jgi:hypothetical protein